MKSMSQRVTEGHKHKAIEHLLFAIKLYKWIIYQRRVIFTSIWNRCIYTIRHCTVLKKQ